MNKMFKWLSIGALVLTLGACTNEQNNNDQQPSGDTSGLESVGPTNPLLAYEGVSEDSVINPVSYQKAIEQLESGDGVLILSRPACSWCQLVMPVIDEVSKEMGLDNVYYVDSSTLTLEEQKEEIQTLVSGNLAVEEDEIIVYTPDVYVFENGEVVGRQLGGVEGSNQEEQQNQLRTIYTELFSTLK